MALDTNAAIAAIRAKAPGPAPAVAIILGSGLGRLADQVTGATRIPYADIPGWERSTAPGHSGELVVGTLGGKRVAVMTSGTVLMPTASAPKPRSIRSSAGVSKFGPATAT